MHEIVISIEPSKELSNMLKKLYRKAKGIDFRVSLFALGVVCYATWFEICRSEMNDKITKLEQKLNRIKKG